MANILFRGTVAPIQPGLVAGGSAAKNSPLTLEEGDWNYKALNDDIQTRAPIANPAFTGVTTVQYNIRSALAAYNQYTATINDSVTSTGCKIGEYLCNAISQNATIKVEVVVRNGITEATSTARVSIRSNILPSVDATIHQQRDATDTLGVTVEAWRDASTGKIVLFAVPTTTVQNVSFKIDTFERTSNNLFVLTTTNVAKNTTGLTQITETAAASFFPGAVNATSFFGSFTGALTGNATTATTLQTARTINGISFNGSGNITVTANTPSSVVFNTSGTGDATGATFDGSAGRTISYNTIGAPSKTGTGASGIWGISITGSSAKTKAVGLIQADVTVSSAVVAGNHYNVINPGITLTLPPNPAVDDTIYFTATVSNWTVARNGKYIMGLLEDMLFDATQKITFGLKFVRDNSTNGWMLI